MTLLTILIVVLIIIGVYIVMVYNKLIAMIEAVNNNNKQIDVQLDRRYKVFESLINSVKKYMDYEKTTLKDVVSLRTAAQTAAAKGDVQGKIAAEDAISKIAGGLNLVFEAYPELKASQNVLQLQEEIVNTENKLAYSKQALNDSIERYTATKKSFFESMIVSIFHGSLDKTFVYWNLPEEKIKEQENYTVKL